MIKDSVNLEQADSLDLYPIHWAAKRALPRVTKALIQQNVILMLLTVKATQL